VQTVGDLKKFENAWKIFPGWKRFKLCEFGFLLSAILSYLCPANNDS
jgi:hypothetical protein